VYFVLVSYWICVVLLWAQWNGPDGIAAWSFGPIFLPCFDTVGWVIWPVKNLSPIWPIMFGGTLNLILFFSISLQAQLFSTASPLMCLRSDCHFGHVNHFCYLLTTNQTHQEQCQHLTWPPRAIMFTQSVLAGRDECSRHDRISVLYAYFESFWSNTYTATHTHTRETHCLITPRFVQLFSGNLSFNLFAA